MPGRILAIGDIHGCDTALRLLLDRVRPTAEDTVVLLGDVVDKGPDTKMATERLLRLRDECRLVYVMGNHEQMLVQALDRRDQGQADWQGIDNFSTFQSYGGPDAIPASHREFWNSGLDFWETETEIFVHARIVPDLPLAAQDAGRMRFDYLCGDELRHYSGKRVICGHTLQNSGVPWVLDGWVCIDTAAFRSGFLTCLDVTTNDLFQASQSGELRVSRLPPPVNSRHCAVLRSPETESSLARPVFSASTLVRDVWIFLALFSLISLAVLGMLVKYFSRG